MSHFITPERVVGQFSPPSRGVNRLLSAHQLPPDALRDASNVIYRNGVLRPRPGYTQLASTVLSGTPTGMIAYVKTDGTAVPVLATTTKQYAYESSAWAEKTGSAQTASTSQIARFTTIALGTSLTNYVIHVNGKDAPTQWTGSSTFAAVSGSPPVWSDICTLADRIVGLVPPYGVRWGNLRSLTVWPARNQIQLAWTVDPVVAIHPLGQSATGVIYKQRSLWLISFTGGQSDATAFRIDPVGYYDGPAGPAAIVDVDGAHVYMTTTGRVGYFNGTEHKWIADGVWPMIQADMHASTAMRTWGIYDPVNHEVHFYYPSIAQSNAIKGQLTITLPRPETGTQSIGVFPGVVTGTLSAGTVARLDNQDKMLAAGTTANRTYQITTDTSGDDGVGFSGYWQTGLIAAPGVKPYRLEGVETFAERGNGYGNLTVKPVHSWTLASEGTVTSAPQINVNLGESDEPTRVDTGFDTQGRFFGLRYEFTSSLLTTVRFKGATLVGLKGA